MQTIMDVEVYLDIVRVLTRSQKADVFRCLGSQPMIVIFSLNLLYDYNLKCREKVLTESKYST